MSITFARGESKLVSITLTPIAVPELSLALELEPALIYRGSEVIIHGVVSNVGAVAAYYFVDFYINDELILSLGSTWGPEGRAIASGSIHDNVAKFIVPEVGHYDVRVSIHNTNYTPLGATTSFDATEPPPGVPNMRIPSSCLCDITAGQCYVLVTNTGNGGGDISCNWYIDGSLVKAQSIYLAPGAHYDFWTDIPIEHLNPGTHTVRGEFAWDGHSNITSCTYTIKAPTTATVYGKVTNAVTGKLIPVTVTTIECWGSTGTKYSTNGYYRRFIPCPHPVTCYIRFRSDGYETGGFSITVDAGDVLERNIALQPL